MSPSTLLRQLSHTHFRGVRSAADGSLQQPVSMLVMQRSCTSKGMVGSAIVQCQSRLHVMMLTCDKLILAKACVDKGVDESSSKILSGRVHCRSCGLPALHQVRLVHLHYTLALEVLTALPRQSCCHLSIILPIDDAIPTRGHGTCTHCQVMPP